MSASRRLPSAALKFAAFAAGFSCIFLPSALAEGAPPTCAPVQPLSYMAAFTPSLALPLVLVVRTVPALAAQYSAVWQKLRDDGIDQRPAY
ncbi:hypothetical protein SAMN05518845_12174 [Variovorax sp. YR750]|uniref:hypothetical protein n=1 Tax=Variovorax sp. YR750 TaxID=1884384 RepID=UPI0008B2FBD7|nr:hypothetical protein [Variovorax sp. YR750]SEM34686.1 hypothetical protein SAMN05518845_12174 [Variovorax sp. YR750]